MENRYEQVKEEYRRESKEEFKRQWESANVIEKCFLIGVIGMVYIFLFILTVLLLPIRLFKRRW